MVFTYDNSLGSVFIFCDAKKLFKNLPKNDFRDLNMYHFPWITIDELKKTFLCNFFCLFKGVDGGLIGGQKSDICTWQRPDTFYFEKRILKYYIFSLKNMFFLLGLRSENRSNTKNTTIFRVIWSSKNVFLHATDDLICDKKSCVRK